MRCTQAKKQLSSYLDGELEPGARESVASHLATCPDCRVAYGRLEAVHAFLARAERYEPRPGLSLRVVAALDARAAARRPFFPSALRLTARAVALTAVIAIGMASGRLLATGSAPARAADPTAMYSLDIFAAAPPDSPGGVYLALLETGRE